MWSSIRGRGNTSNNHNNSNRGPPSRQATIGTFTALNGNGNGNGNGGQNGRALAKTDLNFNKDNNSNSANPQPMYFKGSGPVNLNGATNGQPDYVLDANNIPMRPLMLSPSVNNGSSRNLPAYGVATRGGGSYLLQPPGEKVVEAKEENKVNRFVLQKT